MQTFLIVSNILLWCALAVQIALFFVVTRSVSQFIQKFRLGTPNDSNKRRVVLGQKAPLFSEEDHLGRVVALNKHEGNQTLLLFTLDTCASCQQLIRELPRLQRQAPSLRIIVIAPEDLGAQVKSVPDGASFIRSHSIIENYEIRQVPYAVLVDRHGYITHMDRTSSVSELAEALKGGESHVRKVDETDGRLLAN